MKLIIFLTLIFVLICSTANAITITRDMPTNVGAGQTFTVTYSITNSAATWFAGWTDTITGGCTPSTYQGIMYRNNGDSATQTKVVTYTAPSSGSCSFTGTECEITGNTCTVGGDSSIQVGDSSCTYSAWTPSTCPASCQQTRTVLSGTGCTATSQSCIGGSCGGNQLTLSRDMPTNVGAGQTFTVTYSITNSAATWFAGWTDTITGGCTPSTYQGIMYRNNGDSATQTKVVTYTAPSSGSCSFTGTECEITGNTCTVGGDSSIQVGPSQYQCIGTIPQYSKFCDGDNLGLTADVGITLVSSCGNPKCEYVCDTGYQLSGTACQLIVTSCNNNGVVDSGEECDGANLNGKTCPSLGYVNGTLSCNSCKFVKSDCVSAATCEIYQTLKNGKCEMAGWVWLVIAFFGLMFMMNMMPRR